MSDDDRDIAPPAWATDDSLPRRRVRESLRILGPELRQAEMVRLRESGLSLADISRMVSLSRTRVDQLIGEGLGSHSDPRKRLGRRWRLIERLRSRECMR